MNEDYVPEGKEESGSGQNGRQLCMCWAVAKMATIRIPGKCMAEYLSPGVYVEEFESGGKPMEAVGTSTAGFVGLAVRGPVEGVPQLITNFSEFKRTYGGYLSENEFGEYRFLAYAVEHFFVNGGSRCFVARVAPVSYTHLERCRL